MMEDIYQVTITFACPQKERYREVVSILDGLADVIRQDKTLFVGVVDTHKGSKAAICKGRRRKQPIG